MRVCVIGGGPVGLYAAFRLVRDGHDVVLCERSSSVAGNIRSWGFVKLFSRLDLNVPHDVHEALVAQGVAMPDGAECLTGADFVGSVLDPLAELLGASGRCVVKLQCEVLGIGRGRLLKTDAIMAVGDTRRVGKSFRVLFRETGTTSESVETGFHVVVDASGSYGTATGNRVGIGGIAAPGESAAEAAGLLRRVIPDVKGADAQLVAGRRVAIIGTGYSAITCLRHLQELTKSAPQTAPSKVVWMTRTPEGRPPYKVMDDDPLPQRGALAQFGNQIAAGENAEELWGGVDFEYVPAMAVAAIAQPADKSLHLSLEIGENGERGRDLDVDQLFSLTGFHPDKDLWSELQVHTCYASDGPMNLAQSLLAAKMAAAGGGADASDCLKQAAPGPKTLLNPEPDFYVLGMKSYGRNSTFLMRVGYEQVELLMQKLHEPSPNL